MTEVQDHPHRIVIEDHDGRVSVSSGGTELASSTRGLALREGKLPVRYYIPREDIRMDLLTPTESTSHCPFKGHASYWSIEGVSGVAWCYERPIPHAERIAGLIAFYNDKVDIVTG